MKKQSEIPLAEYIAPMVRADVKAVYEDSPAIGDRYDKCYHEVFVDDKTHTYRRAGIDTAHGTSPQQIQILHSARIAINREYCLHEPKPRIQVDPWSTSIWQISRVQMYPIFIGESLVVRSWNTFRYHSTSQQHG